MVKAGEDFFGLRGWRNFKVENDCVIVYNKNTQCVPKILCVYKLGINGDDRKLEKEVAMKNRIIKV